MLWDGGAETWQDIPWPCICKAVTNASGASGLHATGGWDMMWLVGETFFRELKSLCFVYEISRCVARTSPSERLQSSLLTGALVPIRHYSLPLPFFTS